MTTIRKQKRKKKLKEKKKQKPTPPTTCKQREKRGKVFKIGISLRDGYSSRSTASVNQLQDDWNICYIYTCPLLMLYVLQKNTLLYFSKKKQKNKSPPDYAIRAVGLLRSWILPQLTLKRAERPERGGGFLTNQTTKSVIF